MLFDIKGHLIFKKRTLSICCVFYCDLWLISSVEVLSCVGHFVTPWMQNFRLPCPSPAPGVYSNSSIELVMPSTHLILCRPLFSCLQSFPVSGSFPVSQFFTSGGQSIGVSASVLPMNIPWIFRTDFLEGWLVGFPCSPKASQESSPTPQFKNVNSSALSFLYSSTHIHTRLLGKP